MSELEWVSLSSAVGRVQAAMNISAPDARKWIYEAADNGAVGSRIALRIGFSLDGQPERNVALFGWRDLSDMEGDWWTTDNAEFDPKRAYRGIQIHSGDLAINLGESSPAPGTAENVQSKGKPRQRRGEWNDWMASVAWLSSEGEIHGGLTDTLFMKLVADDMAVRGLDEMPRETVRPATKAILKRFRDEGNLGP